MNKPSIDISKCIVKLGDSLLNTEWNMDKQLGDLIEEDDFIDLIQTEEIVAGGGPWLNKSINIKFIKSSKNYIYQNNNQIIFGLLKLCLLKEVSQKVSNEALKKLPELIYCIMEILSRGYVGDYDIKENIRKILLKMKEVV